MVAFGYDVVNQLLNLLLLAAAAIGIYNLRRMDPYLFLYTLIITAPLLFLNFNDYRLSSSVGRQFLMSCLWIIGFDRILTGIRFGTHRRVKELVFALLLLGMLGLGIFWTILYSVYFIHHKLI
jgi:hypothetical protein